MQYQYGKMCISVSLKFHQYAQRPCVKFPVGLESESEAGPPGQAGWFPLLENTGALVTRCPVRAVRENRVRRLFIRLHWSKCLA